MHMHNRICLLWYKIQYNDHHYQTVKQRAKFGPNQNIPSCKFFWYLKLNSACSRCRLLNIISRRQGEDIIISEEPLLKERTLVSLTYEGVSVLKGWSLLIINTSESFCCCCCLGINGESNVCWLNRSQISAFRCPKWQNRSRVSLNIWWLWGQRVQQYYRKGRGKRSREHNTIILILCTFSTFSDSFIVSASLPYTLKIHKLEFS